ncbi:MAG: putative toxin-antitoxin system toxin component, PIN family [Burkholderiaceae bacterium]|nr:putative toxin-antitoxin system toxin component, PIN family [Burkholderiaceae bacterium]
MSGPPRDAPRVVIDTNALLDWLVFREPAAVALGSAIERRQWLWCATPPMLAEWRAVVQVPLAGRWEANREHALTIDASQWVEMRAMPALPCATLECRDPTDQMFIDLALTCRPSWLVTRDRALLSLRRRAAQQGVAIGTAQQWQLRQLQAGQIASEP